MLKIRIEETPKKPTLAQFAATVLEKLKDWKPILPTTSKVLPPFTPTPLPNPVPDGLNISGEGYVCVHGHWLNPGDICDGVRGKRSINPPQPRPGLYTGQYL